LCAACARRADRRRQAHRLAGAAASALCACACRRGREARASGGGAGAGQARCAVGSRAGAARRRMPCAARVAAVGALCGIAAACGCCRGKPRVHGLVPAASGGVRKLALLLAARARIERWAACCQDPQTPGCAARGAAPYSGRDTRTCSGSHSTFRTCRSKPCCAAVWAMPPPICPQPMIPKRFCCFAITRPVSRRGPSRFEPSSNLLRSQPRNHATYPSTASPWKFPCPILPLLTAPQALWASVPHCRGPERSRRRGDFGTLT